jgi:hypothetical protein
MNEMPSALKVKYAEFYFRERLKQDLWLASKANPYSPQAQDLCEKLFLGPLRNGDHTQFRKIADALKKIDLGSDRPPTTKENEGSLEHYVFEAARYWLDNPPEANKMVKELEGRWTKIESFRKKVKERALSFWARKQLQTQGRQNPSDDDVLAMIKTRGRKDNWSRIWQETGISVGIL